MERLLPFTALIKWQSASAEVCLIFDFHINPYPAHATSTTMFCFTTTDLKTVEPDNQELKLLKL